MVICPKCSSQNEDGAVFCDQCGNGLAGLNSGGGAQPPVVAAPVGGGNSCPSCGASAMPGEVFCENCGAALTNPPLVAAPPTMTPPPAPPMAAAPPVTPVPIIPSPSFAAQLVVSTGQAIPLSGKTTYLIGREDPVSGIFPDVDTTSNDGDAAGVSRRHAQIVQQGAQWLLEDLNSVNGTFVNNQKLAPNGRQPLNPGDQIRLGKWVATFQL